ncbi:MAG: hypothetical protein JNM93_01720 [Bacteriovoracaceae bacterium]|nr:hypothetical protein [Bacteriovoracaceae bacterium]
MRVLFLKCILVFVLIVPLTEVKAGHYDLSVPVKLEVNLDNLLLGHMQYQGNVYLSTWRESVEEITVDFEMVDNKTKAFYKKDLATYFSAYLSYQQLHTLDGVDSNKEIENVYADDMGRKYLKMLLGKKSVRVIPQAGNFSTSRMLNVDFFNLRTSDGVIKQATSQLQLVEKDGKHLIYYRHKNDTKAILVKDIKITLSAYLPATTRTSITINGGTVEVLRENYVSVAKKTK